MQPRNHATTQLKVLITSGGTREKIDPVRYIGNYSSGKMGAALAEVFAAQGAAVKIISGPAEVHYKAPMQRVESAREMLTAVKENLPADIFIAAAAVTDKRPKNFCANKMKKENFDSLELVDNPDILETISTSKQRPRLVVGFAAESENHLKNARQKLTKKSCDLIILNDISALGSNENEVWLVGKNAEKKLPKAPKPEIAAGIAEFIMELYGKY